MGMTIYPNKELREKLEELSKKEKRSMNNLVLFILEKYIEEKNV